MKRNKNKFLGLLCVCLLVLGLTSCEDDQYGIEKTILGRSWTGDIGLSADNGEPVFSTFTFGGDGFGTEYQYYTRDGQPYQDFRFGWDWEDNYNRNIVLSYGRIGTSYMDDLRIIGNQLYGTFHLDESAPGFNFILTME